MPVFSARIRVLVYCPVRTYLVDVANVIRHPGVMTLGAAIFAGFYLSSSTSDDLLSFARDLELANDEGHEFIRVLLVEPAMVFSFEDLKVSDSVADEVPGFFSACKSARSVGASD